MPEERDPRRWLILAIGLFALVAGCAAQYGLAYLIPALRAAGSSLEEATLLVSAPVVGILVTLIAWGAAADRWGERLVLGIGLSAAGVLAVGASFTDAALARWLLLFGVGATSSAIHAASGRLVLGWFHASQRGLAMGIRQMGQPLGVGLAAVILPPLAHAGGVRPPLAVLGAMCLAAGLLAFALVRDPARPRRLPESPPSSSPYRTPYLWRIHLASSLLVIPQWAVAIFAFDYLVTSLGWRPTEAGTLLAVMSLLGAGGRLVAGHWSDRVGSRLGPMRILAVLIGLVMVALGTTSLAAVGAAAAALAAAMVITVSPNGLAFTAVAERAGSGWAGRALGVQNTFQNLAASASAPPLAFVIASAGGGQPGYGLAFLIVACLPFLAAVAIPPRRAEGA